MKKTLIALCAVMLLTSATSFAKGDGDGKKKQEYYFTSKFGHNWFINIDGSINWWGGSDKLNFNNDFGNNSHIFNTMDFGFGGSLSFGKWITHNLAVRLAYDVHQGKTWLPGTTDKSYGNGFMFSNLEETDFFTDFDGYDGLNGYADVKFMHHNLHGDVMINLADLFGGRFDPERVYTPIFYAGAGFGYATQNITKDNWYDVIGVGKMTTGEGEDQSTFKPNYELTLDAGFMNVFRLNKYLDLHLDVQYMATRWSTDSYEHEYHSFFANGSEERSTFRSRRFDQNLAAVIGLTWTIGGKRFEKAVACDYSEYENRIKQLERDLEECNNSLNDCNSNLDGCNKNLNDCNTALEDCNKKLVDTDGDGLPDLWDNCPEERGKIENGGCPIREKISANFDDMINYETNKADLKPSTYQHLDKLVKLLEDNPDHWVSIDGHTDNVGTDAINDPLSQKRVDNVKSYLVEKGIDESRIIARGHGSHEPLVPNTSEANRAKNRRTEVRLCHE